MQNNEFETNPAPGGTGDIDLSQFDEDYTNAPIEERDFEDIPDGKYQVNVERVELTKSKTAGNPMLKWTLRILAPHFRGRLVWRYNVLASKDQIKWLKNDLHTCGLDLDKLSDLSANLEKLLNVKLEITKRTKGENENVYLNKKIELAEGVEEFNPANVSDIPF
jgi:hypothetical protein